MLRFHTLQSPDLFRVPTFRKGDSVFLAKGSCQGTVGTFLNFRDDDPKWADIFERTFTGSLTPGRMARTHAVSWCAYDRNNYTMTTALLSNRADNTDKTIRPVSYSQVNVPPRLAIGNKVIELLSVSPIQDDHDTLASLLGRDQWKIHSALSLQSASAFLKAHGVPLVVCEHDLSPDTWTQLLDETRLLAIPPVLIMTCRVADDSLWAEALNLGAYDVLAKPLDRTEVTRVLSSAWLHWQRQYCVPTMPRKLMPTAAVAWDHLSTEVFAT